MLRYLLLIVIVFTTGFVASRLYYGLTLSPVGPPPVMKSARAPIMPPVAAPIAPDPLPSVKPDAEQPPANATAIPLPPPDSAPLTATPSSDDPYHVPDGNAPKRKQDDTPDPNYAPVFTPTGIPELMGPKGGIFHYSKTGKKVYEKLSK